MKRTKITQNKFIYFNDEPLNIEFDFDGDIQRLVACESNFDISIGSKKLNAKHACQTGKYKIDLYIENLRIPINLSGYKKHADTVHIKLKIT
jgi:hypothetical protein